MKTIYRVRSIKSRNGVSNGPVFFGVHLGKRSFYVQKPNAVRQMNVSIKDNWDKNILVVK
jgi:hypothetical protein